ncbi:hypothetical protein BDW71DRAFT_151187 [Aspergillus fruticulosus]
MASCFIYLLVFQFQFSLSCNLSSIFHLLINGIAIWSGCKKEEQQQQQQAAELESSIICNPQAGDLHMIYMEEMGLNYGTQLWIWLDIKLGSGSV